MNRRSFLSFTGAALAAALGRSDTVAGQEAGGVVEAGARLERLAGGFEFTEGPTCDRDGSVFFTDQPNNRIMKWSVDGTLSTFLQPAGRANGMYFDARGILIACADERTELWAIAPDGTHTVLAGRFDDKPLNGPNDVWVRPDGALYFTDPFYARPWWGYTSRPQAEHTGEHQIADHRYGMGSRLDCACCTQESEVFEVWRLAATATAFAAQETANVYDDWHSCFATASKEGLILLTVLILATGHTGNNSALVAVSDGPVQFGEGVANAGGRDDRLRDQSALRVVAKILHQPLVVPAHTVQLQLAIIGIGASALERNGRIEHLRVNSINRHIGKARLSFPHIDVFELKESADEAPVVRLVNMIFVNAVRRGASDIHLEPYEKVFRVRFRDDGVLHEMMTPPKRLEAALTSRVKIMASLDIAERRLPLDGRIKLRYHQREIDLRVSTLPTIFGEKTVLRILDREALQLDRSRLGFDPWSLEHFTRAIRQPYGMILITGPTGSGKTTTLYSAIHTINSPDVNIMTVEDPVEYNLKGVNQVQVKEEIGRTFAAALRSFLRQDPDIILVGETRDLETAQIAVRAALTGHLVLSTLHTNDSPSTVARLLDMGVPPFLVASSLTLILAQRLARRVCMDCRQPYEVDEDSLTPYGYLPQGRGRLVLYRGKGCATCSFTGMKGRVAIYEVMPVTEELRSLILRAAPTADLREVAASQGMKTLRHNALGKAVEGVTIVEEILRVTIG